jgi:hypothetical protein
MLSWKEIIISTVLLFFGLGIYIIHQYSQSNRYIYIFRESKGITFLDTKTGNLILRDMSGVIINIPTTQVFDSLESYKTKK